MLSLPQSAVVIEMCSNYMYNFKVANLKRSKSQNCSLFSSVFEQPSAIPDLRVAFETATNSHEIIWGCAF